MGWNTGRVDIIAACFIQGYSSIHPRSQPVPLEACGNKKKKVISTAMAAEALNAYVTAKRFNIYHVDELHECVPKACTFAEPLEDGTHFVCEKSLRVHVCAADERLCAIQHLDHNVRRCSLTGKEFYLNDYEPVVVGRDVPLFAGERRDVTRTRSRDGAMARFADAAGRVLRNLTNRERRRAYNRAFFVRRAGDIVARKLEKEPKLMQALRELFLAHVSSERLPDEGAAVDDSFLEDVKQFLCELMTLLLCYSEQTESKKNFLLSNSDESTLYLLKRTVYGVRFEDSVVLLPRFRRLTPLPGDRLLPRIFEVSTTRLTECSSLLQRMMAEKACRFRMKQLNHF